MPKKTKVLSDKYKSTTKIYPKVIMASLTPEVREYIESQGIEIDDTTTSATNVWSSQKTKQYVDGQLDDNITSATKVWSSKKTQESLDKGIYYSNATPTTVLTDTFYTSSQIENYTSLINFQVGDLIIRVDNSAAKEIYKITNIQSGTPQTLFVTKVADFGGGGQKYQHHITIEKYISSTNYVSILLTIPNSSNTPLTINDVMAFLSINFVYSSSGTDIRHRSGYIASGSQRTTSSDAWTIESIFYNDSTSLYYKGTGKGATNGNTLAINTITTFEDVVIAL